MGLDGYYAVCVRLTDAAGNITYGKSQQVYRNVGGPSFTSLLGTNEASDGFVNDSEKSSTLAAWALSAAAYTAATYTLPLDDTSPVVCDGLQTYGQGSIPHVDAMTSDKPWVICVKLVDGAANVTYGKSEVIVRDTVAPTFTTLNGANEASDGSINATESTSGLTLLNLTASGYDTILYTLALDDTSGTVDCSTGQTINQAGLPLISDLASDKPYTVCAKLSDDAGNITYGKSQAITRDVVAPAFTSLIKANEGADGSINDSEKTQTNPL